MLKSNLLRLAAAAVVATPVATFAAGSHDGGHGASPTGMPGKASAASRTIEVILHDNYYEPDSIEVKAGETVRFRIRNAGEFVHEFNIGTAEMHASHQDEMMMMMQHGVLMPDHVDMAAAKKMQASMGHGMHDDPNSVLLEPGKSGEIVWTFPEDADVAIEFACNVPGHYQSGMVGSVAIDH
ncbi:MAG: cupredoxin domain-containing protein [Pseudomonadota bacterium]|nr:cupredoxin domain-containing protein [Pseudomonadota bacterium]